jgi:hypothetical protein
VVRLDISLLAQQLLPLEGGLREGVGQLDLESRDQLLVVAQLLLLLAVRLVKVLRQLSLLLQHLLQTVNVRLQQGLLVLACGLK